MCLFPGTDSLFQLLSKIMKFFIFSFDKLLDIAIDFLASQVMKAVSKVL